MTGGYQYKDEIEIHLDGIVVYGDLAIPSMSDSIVIFAHGSGSGRHSPRNKYVAKVLQEAGFATLLFDLLTLKEEKDLSRRFAIDLLTDRLVNVTHWLRARDDFNMNIGYFGASTGAAAALESAARFGDSIKAVVSRGGRPDLALYNLPVVKAPTLLIVGSLDLQVIHLNEKAYDELRVEKELVIVDGASHLFEEEGKLEIVAQHATRWFARYLKHIYIEKAR